MKRTLLTILVICMLATLVLAGCNQDADKDDDMKKTEEKATKAPEKEATAAPEKEEMPLLTDPGQLPIVNESIDLVFGITSDPLVTDYEDNYLTKRLIADTGINLSVYLFPSDAAEAKIKLSAMVSAKEKMPDIISLGMSHTEKANYGMGGTFIALNQYFDDGKAVFYDTQSAKWLSPTEKSISAMLTPSSDGNIYGFPFFYADPTDPTAQGFWINDNWLTALSLDMPKTTAEFKDVLMAFRDNDPNGNGKADEIPLIGQISWKGDVVETLLNAFIYFSDYRLNADDDYNLSAPFIDPEFRKGLIYIKSLSDEGLISPLTYSQSWSELKTIMSSPDTEPTLVGVICNHPHLTFPTDGSVPRTVEYKTMEPLIGPEGVQFQESSISKPSPWTYITNTCEYPEAAFRLLDYLCEEEISTTMRFGEKGVNWMDAKEGDVPTYPGYLALRSSQTTENVWTVEQNVMWRRNINFLPPKLFGANVFVPRDNATAEHIYSNLWSDTIGLRDSKVPTGNLVADLIYTAEEASSITEIESTLKTYVDEARARFAKGEIDPANDDDWNSYISDLEAIGLQQWLDVAETAYKRMNGQ